MAMHNKEEWEEEMARNRQEREDRADSLMEKIVETITDTDLVTLARKHEEIRRSKDYEIFAGETATYSALLTLAQRGEYKFNVGTFEALAQAFLMWAYRDAEGLEKFIEKNKVV